MHKASPGWIARLSAAFAYLGGVPASFMVSMQGIQPMLFLDFDYVHLSPSLTFSFLIAPRQRTPPHFPWESLQRRRQTHPFQSGAYYSALQSCSSGRAGPERALICALLLCSPQSQTTRVPGARLKILKALLNNKYFISPESHTQLQMAKTKVSHFNENLISHMKRCL